jgi:glyoxylase-like metal-dependent hydrolase (beta-lactamase superfamily II)
MKKIKLTVSILACLVILIQASTAYSKPFSDNKGEIYVFESDGSGFNTKTIFYDDGKEVVAFDAQFTEATAIQAIAFLKTKTKNPIKWLVVTHPNPDKFNGIPAFKKEGAKIIMSTLTAHNLKGVHDYKKYYFVHLAKMFTEETYPQLPTADITFNDDYKINLANGGIVELKELNMSGVSLNQTVGYIPMLQSLVVGDLVHHKTHAWLEGPIVQNKPAYSSQNWINTLTKIQSLYTNNTTIYGGRGASEMLSIAIPQQIAYLKTADEIVHNYIHSLIGNNITDKKSKVDYTALTAAFEKQFPNYTLPYMITYGAYGIVANSK